MKMRVWWLVLALSSAVQSASLCAQTVAVPELKPVAREAEAARMAAVLLARYHYKRVPVDDALSVKIFDGYLKALDSEKLFFLQADIDLMAEFRTRLDDAILSQDLGPPFAMFNLYAKRAAERFTYARTLLKGGFDFQKMENFQHVRENEPWPKTDAEMREVWRKRVKNDWLRLKLAGKTTDSAIVEILDKRYENFLKRIGQIKSTDAFQIFMNAYTTAIEPHTSYLGPRAAQDFGISMRLSLVGIGASLSLVDEYVTIRELIPGGPASLSGDLKVGDRIVGVGQGARGAVVDILGWRLDDVVALIRGAPDSVVVLDILPVGAAPDAKHKLLSFARKTISLESQAAKASVRSVTEGRITRRIGVITLPTFYEDFDGRQKGTADFKSATRDVVRLLDGLKKERIDSLVIDLRNNGGGSLAQAIELTGLFIDKGPVVQQRNASGEISVGSDTKAGVSWDGPLGVLINRASASASEIFAAAIQDYGRGIIIGEASFGKGTVQTMVDLDRVAKNDKAQFGELKMTVAQFFRINGGTTQLRGVTPDILLPSTTDATKFGESSLDNALPWTQVKAADYVQTGDIKGLLPGLQSLHDARVSRNRDFKDLLEDISEGKMLRQRNQISLNEGERRRELDAQEARLNAREARDTAAAGVKAGTAVAGKSGVARNARLSRDDGLRPDERSLASDLAATKARTEAKDVLLDETVNILADAVAALKGNAGLAARSRNGAPLPTE